MLGGLRGFDFPTLARNDLRVELLDRESRVALIKIVEVRLLDPHFEREIVESASTMLTFRWWYAESERASMRDDQQLCVGMPCLRRHKLVDGGNLCM